MKISNIIFWQVICLSFSLIGGLMLGEMLKEEEAGMVIISISLMYFSGVSAGICCCGLLERIKGQ